MSKERWHTQAPRRTPTILLRNQIDNPDEPVLKNKRVDQVFRKRLNNISNRRFMVPMLRKDMVYWFKEYYPQKDVPDSGYELFIQIARYIGLIDTFSDKWLFEQHVPERPDREGTDSKIWDTGNLTYNYARSRRTRVILDRTVVGPYFLSGRDPLSNFGLAPIGRGKYEWVCCASHPSSPGCWYGDLVKYDFLPGFSKNEDAVIHAVVSKDEKKIKELWDQDIIVGTEWLKPEWYKGVHDKIVKLKSSLSDDDVFGYMRAFVGDDGGDAKVGQVLDEILQLQFEYNEVQCSGECESTVTDLLYYDGIVERYGSGIDVDGIIVPIKMFEELWNHVKARELIDFLEDNEIGDTFIEPLQVIEELGESTVTYEWSDIVEYNGPKEWLKQSTRNALATWDNQQDAVENLKNIVGKIENAFRGLEEYDPTEADHLTNNLPDQLDQKERDEANADLTNAVRALGLRERTIEKINPGDLNVIKYREIQELLKKAGGLVARGEPLSVDDTDDLKATILANKDVLEELKELILEKDLATRRNKILGPNVVDVPDINPEEYGIILNTKLKEYEVAVLEAEKVIERFLLETEKKRREKEAKKQEAEQQRVEEEKLKAAQLEVEELKQSKLLKADKLKKQKRDAFNVKLDKNYGGWFFDVNEQINNLLKINLSVSDVSGPLLRAFENNFETFQNDYNLPEMKEELVAIGYWHPYLNRKVEVWADKPWETIKGQPSTKFFLGNISREIIHGAWSAMMNKLEVSAYKSQNIDTPEVLDKSPTDPVAFMSGHYVKVNQYPIGIVVELKKIKHTVDEKKYKVQQLPGPKEGAIITESNFQNAGNSCWMDSILAALFKLPSTPLEKHIRKAKYLYLLNKTLKRRGRGNNDIITECGEKEATNIHDALLSDIKELQSKPEDPKECKLRLVWNKCVRHPVAEKRQSSSVDFIKDLFEVYNFENKKIFAAVPDDLSMVNVFNEVKLEASNANDVIIVDANLVYNKVNRKYDAVLTEIDNFRLVSMILYNGGHYMTDVFDPRSTQWWRFDAVKPDNEKARKLDKFDPGKSGSFEPVLYIYFNKKYKGFETKPEEEIVVLEQPSILKCINTLIEYSKTSENKFLENRKDPVKSGEYIDELNTCLNVFKDSYEALTPAKQNKINAIANTLLSDLGPFNGIMYKEGRIWTPVTKITMAEYQVDGKNDVAELKGEWIDTTLGLGGTWVLNELGFVQFVAQMTYMLFSVHNSKEAILKANVSKKLKQELTTIYTTEDLNEIRRLITELMGTTHVPSSVETEKAKREADEKKAEKEKKKQEEAAKKAKEEAELEKVEEQKKAKKITPAAVPTVIPTTPVLKHVFNPSDMKEWVPGKITDDSKLFDFAGAIQAGDQPINNIIKDVIQKGADADLLKDFGLDAKGEGKIGIGTRDATIFAWVNLYRYVLDPTNPDNRKYMLNARKGLAAAGSLK